MPERTAIVLLTRTPNRDQLQFYERFKAFHYDVFVVVDDNAWNDRIEGLGKIQINTEICINAGFKHLNPVITEGVNCPATAWEKSLYFFCVMCPHYDHVWIFEDDVFIPRNETIVRIDNAFDQDLLCAENPINTKGETKSWFWYKFIPSRILPPPWSKSMVCAVRLSKKLLGEIAKFVHENRNFSPTDTGFDNKKYLFVEYIINTIALRSKLTIATPDSLSTVVWRREWTIDDLKPEFVYHPVKDLDLHNKYRNIMQIGR